MVAPTKRERASLSEWGPYMARSPFSKPICAKEKRTGPPSVVCTLQTLSEVTSQAESCMMHMCVSLIIGSHTIFSTLSSTVSKLHTNALAAILYRIVTPPTDSLMIFNSHFSWHQSRPRKTFNLENRALQGEFSKPIRA